VVEAKKPGSIRRRLADRGRSFPSAIACGRAAACRGGVQRAARFGERDEGVLCCCLPCRFQQSLASVSPRCRSCDTTSCTSSRTLWPHRCEGPGSDTGRRVRRGHSAVALGAWQLDLHQRAGHGHRQGHRRHTPESPRQEGSTCDTPSATHSMAACSRQHRPQTTSATVQHTAHSRRCS
jgi:hypothetical protein